MIDEDERVQLTVCLSLAAPLPLRESVERAGGGRGKEERSLGAQEVRAPVFMRRRRSGAAISFRKRNFNWFHPGGRRPLAR